MKRSKKITLGVGLLAALVLAVILINNQGTEVEAVQAKIGSITRTVEDTGYVQPATDYELFTTQSARVIGVPVKTGQTVNQGQTLVIMENLDLAVQLNNVRAQLEQVTAAIASARSVLNRTELELKDARDNYNRMQKLYEAEATTQVEYEKALLQVNSLEHTLEEQKSQLNSALAQKKHLDQSLQQLTLKEQQLLVKSPVDGIVLNLPAEQEQVLAPGTSLATVAVPEQLEIKADLLSDDLGEVRVGQPVTINAPILGQKTLKGEVKKIYPQAEEKQSALGVIQRRVPVIISLNTPAHLKPGYEVRVAIETVRRQNVLLVPLECIHTTRDNQKEVMVVENYRVQHRVVETGISNGESVEITGGLAEGNQIIRDGSLELAEKAKVKVKR